MVCVRTAMSLWLGISVLGCTSEHVVDEDGGDAGSDARSSTSGDASTSDADATPDAVPDATPPPNVLPVGIVYANSRWVEDPDSGEITTPRTSGGYEVRITGDFPTAFRLVLDAPPPEDAQFHPKDAPDDVRVLMGFITAGAPGSYGPGLVVDDDNGAFEGLRGASREHMLFWVNRALESGELGDESPRLSAGYSLLHVQPGEEGREIEVVSADTPVSVHLGATPPAEALGE